MTISRTRLSAVALLIVLLAAAAGCSNGGEKAKKDSGKPGESPAASQPFAQTGMTKISDNPKYFGLQERTARSAPVKDLDSLIRPVLVRLFEGAKLIDENDEPVTERDGEVVLNSMKYSVRRLLDAGAGDELHKALTQEAHFSRTPRIGAKPVHGRQFVLMSLSKSTSRGGYSLEIRLDLVEQTILIKSYKPGSKSDRLM